MPDTRLPLLGGAYSARSIIAASQRCINLFPEANPKDSPTPTTHYQRPGLTALAQGPASPVRGLYRASQGNAYAVIGQGVYYISPTWQLKLLGQMQTLRTNPVSMVDNGTTLVVVDGSPYGYTVDLATGSFAQIVDSTGTFAGADKVDVIDTFVIWNMLASINFGSTLSNEISFDPLYFAGKSGYPDLLQTLKVNRHEILLFGQLKTEIWYDAGNPQFPFAEIPGAYFEFGVAAKYSVASNDINVFFLGRSLEGHGVVYMIRGYECKRISNHALEYQIRRMLETAGTIEDAIGYTYQQDGHTFYVLCFPTGNQTWVYDSAIGDPLYAWHQRCWTDSNGNLQRDRTNCHAFVYETNIVGDWQNGTIYKLDLDSYTDEVAGAQGPCTYIRTFPHVTAGFDTQGRPQSADGKRVQFNKFLADIECGQAPLDALGNVATVGLRWSDDRGRTFNETVLMATEQPGNYLTQPQWRGIGIARDRVFELSYSIAGPAALNSAWLEALVLPS